jgi:hypothetical protein
VQLHPKDTGGAMIEFNRTHEGADPMGAYAPAGPAWQKAIRQDLTRCMVAAEMECPVPAMTAARDRDCLAADGRIDVCGMRFRLG